MSWSKGDHLVPTGTPIPTSQQMSFNSGHAQVKKSFSFRIKTEFFFFKFKSNLK